MSAKVETTFRGDTSQLERRISMRVWPQWIP
jgi:hypothetical protein